MQEAEGRSPATAHRRRVSMLRVQGGTPAASSRSTYHGEDM